MKKARVPTYEEVSKYYVYLCKITGVLPLETKCTFVKYLPVVYFHLINVVYYTMHTTEGIRLLIGNEFDIAFIFESVLVHGLCSRFLLLHLYCGQIKQLMAMCQQLWRLLLDEEGKKAMKFEKNVRCLMYYFLWMTVFIIIVYDIAAHFVRLPPTTINGTERRILPSRFYVDVQEDPWFQIASAFINVITLSYTIIIMTIETVGPFFIMMACGFLRSIQFRLISMRLDFNSSSTIVETARSLKNLPKLNLKDVMNCVTFHQKILEFCEQIEKLTGKLFFIQVLCTAYNISLIAIRLLENDQRTMQYVPMLFFNLVQLSTCHWFSEYLLNESQEIANATYGAMLTHPTYDAKANQMLLFMMMRAQKPVEMKAGGYVRLSLETFGSICTSAVSFFAVLRSVDENKE